MQLQFEKWRGFFWLYLVSAHFIMYSFLIALRKYHSLTWKVLKDILLTFFRVIH